MRATKESPPRFRVNDWVSLLYGPRTVLAQIIEDRGPLGVRGRRLYRIRLALGQEEPTTFEAPEEDLKKDTRLQSLPVAVSSEAVSG